MDERTIETIMRDAGAVVAYLFGSRAAGRARDTSDIDIAVLFDRDVGLLEQEDLTARLAGALEAPDVDVVVLDRAPLELQGKVIQEGRVIFSADEARRVAFEVRTRSMYFDFVPYLRSHTRSLINRVAERGLARG